jgi:hypothetical protein
MEGLKFYRTDNNYYLCIIKRIRYEFMEKDLIRKYIANFRIFLSPFMKKDVAMKAVVYPYDDGAILLVELAVGKTSSDEFKSGSVTLVGAMNKTGLFEEPESSLSIKGTRIVVSNSRVVIIKSSEADLWSAKAAFDDVSKFMDFIKEKKYGRR